MKKLRRLICALIAVSMFPVVFSSAATDNVSGEVDYQQSFVTVHTIPDDVIDTEFETAVSFLQGMSVIDSKPFMPWETITRAQMVEYTIKTFNKGHVSETGITYFNDVSANADSAPYINAAVELGYINGVGNRLFNPDKEALFEQAAKVLTMACGYKIMASVNGGFVDGYVKMADDAGITKGIEKDVSDELTRGEFAVMLYNALNADAMTLEYRGGDYSYEIGNSVLSEKFNIEVEKGVLQATEDVSLYENKVCPESYVVIGGEYYETSGIVLDEYLGYELEFYYDAFDEDSPKLVAARPTTKNLVYKIYSDNIEPTSDISQIDYLEADTRIEKLDISLLADFVYNGKGMSAFADKDILLKNGYLLAVDNNADEKIDVVIVSEYENYVVKSADAEAEIITDYYGKTDLDLAPVADSLKIFKNGKEVELSSIKKWDVLSVYKSKNLTGKKIMRIEATDNVLSGKVTTVATEYYGIEGAEYQLAENLKTAIAQGKEKDLSVNATFKFYLDSNGDIAAIDDSTDSEMKYGLVLKIYNNIAEEYSGVKLYTQSGLHETFKFRDMVKYNGTKTDAESVVNEFKENYAKNPVKCKLVKYKLNSEGLITDFYSYYGTDKDCITLNVKYSERTSINRNYSFTTDSTNSALGGDDMYGISNESILFSVPEDFATDKDNGIYKENDFAMMKIKDLLNQNDYKGTEIYDTDLTDRNTKVALIKIPTQTDYDSESKLVFVNKKYEVYDEETDEITEIIEGYFKGEPIKLSGKDEDTLKNIKAGDVIHVLKNVKGQVTSVRVLFRPAKTQPTGADGPEFETVRNNGTHVNITQYLGRKQAIEVSQAQGLKSTMFTVFGTVVASSNNGLVISYREDLTKPVTYFQMSSVITYYVCTIKNNKVEYTVGSINDVREYDDVFVQSRDGMHQDVCVIRYR